MNVISATSCFLYQRYQSTLVGHEFTRTQSSFSSINKLPTWTDRILQLRYHKRWSISFHFGTESGERRWNGQSYRYPYICGSVSAPDSLLQSHTIAFAASNNCHSICMSPHIMITNIYKWTFNKCANLHSNFLTIRSVISNISNGPCVYNSSVF